MAVPSHSGVRLRAEVGLPLPEQCLAVSAMLTILRAAGWNPWEAQQDEVAKEQV